MWIPSQQEAPPMTQAQPGILEDETRLARYLYFSIDSREHIETALTDLSDAVSTDDTVIGIGESLTRSLGKEVPGLTTFKARQGKGLEIPSTPAALWCWLRGTDRGELFHRSRLITELLEPAFTLQDCIDAHQYDNNRDMSGYEDGTENPMDEAAISAAIVQNQEDGLNGGSFVAVQQWLHDLDKLQAMSTEEQDNVIGRHIEDNEEFDEAPESAHVKRSAQESFSPEAFILRRSMPWSEAMETGLMFVAFGNSFNAFEAILTRMTGEEDGTQDGLFSFTRPITGAYFWCPPIKDNRLDLSALGL